MIKVYRPVLLLFCLSFCLSFCMLIAACHDSAPSPASPASEPPKSEASKPLPDVGAMVQRMVTQDGCKDFTAEMRMVAENAEGKRDQVDFRLQRKYSENGAATFLTVLSPKEESDKAILAVEKNNQPTEAFSYLAGLKRLAKLDSARQLGFRGAKVTVQELLGMELGKYSHDAGKREMVDGEPFIKVEFKAKYDLGLAFPRIIGYFQEKDQAPARFELFGENGELSKKVTIEEVKPIQNHQTIARLTIEDLGQKLKLKLEMRKIEFDKGLSDKLFTEQNLKSSVTSSGKKLDAGQ